MKKVSDRTIGIVMYSVFFLLMISGGIINMFLCSSYIHNGFDAGLFAALGTILFLILYVSILNLLFWIHKKRVKGGDKICLTKRLKQLILSLRNLRQNLFMRLKQETSQLNK